MSKKGNTKTKKKTKAKPKRNFWLVNRWAALVLFATAIVLYINTISFDYVLDDQMVITDNQFTKRGFAGIWDILRTDSFQGYFGEQKTLVTGGRYRPLSIVSFAVEHQFFGLNNSVSHFINVLLYALTGLLLFRVLGQCFPKSNEKKWYMSLAFVGSILFVLHPLHTEVVANIKGRDEILCLLGSLAALYYSFRFIRTEKWSSFFGALLCFFLALLSKENALTFLAIIPLALYFFGKKPIAKWASFVLVLMAVAALYLFLRFRVMGYLLSSGREITDLMNNPFVGMSTGEQLATAFYTLGLYLKLLIFPHPLTHDYYPYHIPIMNWSQIPVLFSFVLYLGLGVLAILGTRKKRIISFAILFYLCTLSIVSNLPFTVGTFMNERFLYMPSIGLCILLGYFIARKLPEVVEEKSGEFNILSMALFGIFVLGFAVKTISRIPDWKNRMTLNQAAIKVSYNSARANCFMATALYELEYLNETDNQRKQQLLDDINYYINRALEIYPNYSSALTVKAGAVAEQHKYSPNLELLLNEFYNILYIKKRLPFIDQYLEYLGKRGEDTQKLCEFYLRTGRMMAQRFNDQNAAVEYLQDGLNLDPANVTLQLELSSLKQR